MPEKLTKIWVTRYALTSGIFEAEAEVENHSEGMAVVPQNYETGEYKKYFHGKDWHLTKESAIKRAEEMRVKKISSLQKLENMTFTIEVRNGSNL
jgi:hypothetical protein